MPKPTMRQEKIKTVLDYCITSVLSRYDMTDFSNRVNAIGDLSDAYGLGNICGEHEARKVLSSRLDRMTSHSLDRVYNEILDLKKAGKKDKPELDWKGAEYHPEKHAYMAKNLAGSLSSGWFFGYEEMEPEKKADLIKTFSNVYGITIMLPGEGFWESLKKSGISDFDPRDYVSGYLVELLLGMGEQELMKIDEVSRKGGNSAFIKGNPAPCSKFNVTPESETSKAVFYRHELQEKSVHAQNTAKAPRFGQGTRSPSPRKSRRIGSQMGWLPDWEKGNE